MVATVYRIIRSLGWMAVLITLTQMTACKKEVFQNREKPQVILTAADARVQGDIIHLYEDTVYVLGTDLMVDSGKTLVIDAGTLIKVNNRLGIEIRRGAKIEAIGTADAPIVFTSAAAKGGAGVGTGTSGGERWWFGLRIYGDAGNSASTGSGTLQYIRIEFAGGNFAGIGFPPLLLQDVTQQTIVDHIQVSYAFSESSFVISGGDVNASHLISYAGAANDFQLNNGYIGKLQYLLAYRHPYFPVSGSGGTGGLDFGGLLIEDAGTFPLIANLTVIGPHVQNGASIEYSDTIPPGTSGIGRRVAALIVKGGKFNITNSALMGFPKGGFYLDDRNAAISLNNRESQFTHSIVHSSDSARAFYLGPTVFPPLTSKDFRNLMMNPDFGNHQVLSPTEFMLANPFDYDVQPDPFPQTGSLLLSGAVYEGVFTDPFFKAVAWRGALGTDKWLQGWTNFVPLQTGYNE